MSEMTRQQVYKAALDLMNNVLTDRDFLRPMLHEMVHRELDYQLSERRLEEHITNMISGSYAAERRRMFLAGAEWARRQFAEATPPDGFYHAMEAEAKAFAEAQR